VDFQKPTAKAHARSRREPADVRPPGDILEIWPGQKVRLNSVKLQEQTHLGFADEYINKRVSDPRGTGGTPYMQWLAQLIRETREHMIA
jgi:hypothetical protein